MQKLISLLFIAAIVASCAECPKTTPETKSKDPLSGTFASRDAKAKTLLRNMNLFAKADFSYVNELVTEDFTLQTAGDTAVVATGPEEAITYWNNIFL